MATAEEIQRYQENVQNEVDASLLYRTISEVESQTSLAQVYRRMAEVEAEHIVFWEEKLKAAEQPLLPHRPTWRTRVLMWVARRFGAQAVLPTLISRERDGSRGYLAQSEAKDTVLPSQEGSHRRLLVSIAGQAGGGLAGGVLAQFEGRHKASGGNALRAAVLGANDGLVSNLSLVMGVSGASLEPKAVLITGLAGLLAGAASMALGEWLSVQSSRELYEHQIGLESAEIAGHPEEEQEELALIYRSKGLAEEHAKVLAAQIMSDAAVATDTLAREELGINPEELGGSAFEAALTSFMLFALGAIIPVSPFIFWTGTEAVVISLIFSTIGLFIIGGVISVFTGKSLLISGVRMVVFSLLAAGIVYGIGRLIGHSIGG